MKGESFRDGRQIVMCKALVIPTLFDDVNFSSSALVVEKTLPATGGKGSAGEKEYENEEEYEYKREGRPWMNREQQVWLVIGLALAALAGVSPPWYYQAAGKVDSREPFRVMNSSSTGARQLAGYRSIFTPPPKRHTKFAEAGETQTMQWEPRIDFSRLAVLWVVIGAITAAALLGLSEPSGDRTPWWRKKLW